MVVIVGLLVAPSCSGKQGASQSSTSSVAPAADPTSTAPPLCTAEAVRQSVDRFVAAMNDGDAAIAEALVAPSLRFGWFSVDSERLGSDAKDRSTLGSYLRNRVDALEQTELLEFDFSSYRAQDRTGHFAFRFAQRSTDYGDATVIGKGAIDCDTGLIIVWSVGPRE